MFHDVGNAVGSLRRGAEVNPKDFVLVAVDDREQPRAAFLVPVQFGNRGDFGNVFFLEEGEGHGRLRE